MKMGIPTVTRVKGKEQCPLNVLKQVSNDCLGCIHDRDSNEQDFTITCSAPAFATSNNFNRLLSTCRSNGFSIVNYDSVIGRIFIKNVSIEQYKLLLDILDKFKALNYNMFVESTGIKTFHIVITYFF